MSNSWACSLIFTPDEFHTANAVTRTLALFSILDYSCQNPATGDISLMSAGGTEEMTWRDRSDAIAYMNQAGGHLQLWKGEIDIGISSDPIRLDTVAPVNPSNPESQGLKSLTLYVDDIFVREDAFEKEAVSQDFEWVFTSLCKLLHPIYGYSADETAIDQFWPMYSQLFPCMKHQHKPPVLFWLNYFSEHYGSDVDLAALTKLGAMVVPIWNGWRVSFFDDPWRVSLEKLMHVNEEWQREP